MAWREPRLADPLEVAYFEAGPPDGEATLLLRGFPSDIHDYVDVVPGLVDAGHRVIVPNLRGHGPARFIDAVAVDLVRLSAEHLGQQNPRHRQRLLGEAV